MEEVYGFLYFKTVPGFFKILEIIFSVLSFICVLAFSATWTSVPILFVGIITIIAFVYALVLTLNFVINCIPHFNHWNWNKVDGVAAIVLAIFIFTASTLLTPGAHSDSALAAATVFSYVNGLAFAANAIWIILKT